MKRERKEMPGAAALLADMRKRLGLMPADLKIRAAMQGRPGFYARENGEEFGTRLVKGSVEIYKDLYLISQARAQVSARQAEPPVWFEVAVDSFDEAVHVLNLLMAHAKAEPAGAGEQQSKRET